MNYDLKYPDPDRVNFHDYLRSYPDLQSAFGDNVEAARKHWITCGRYEGRHVKLNNVDYKKISTYVKHNHITGSYSNSDFNLVTCLYNDKNIQRDMEYRLALNLNLYNENIKSIYIYWDTTTGVFDWVDLNIHNKIKLINFSGRPDFHTLFNYCNQDKSNIIWCICNGDIVPTKTMSLIHTQEMHNKLLALTRWEFVSENEITVFNEHRKPNGYSQDTWIIKPPFDTPPEFKNIYMGKIACDSELGNITKQNGIAVYNPCMDVKTLHIHLQNSRTQTYDISNAGYITPTTLAQI